MRTLDLFAGIGGISLGLEKAGFRTVAFCEIQPYCHEVLRKNFPGVPIYDDVTTLTADTLARDGIEIDAICGGFPCQDLSFAGKRAGLEGARSGLWGEYRRLIGEIRPQFVIVENVPGLLSLGFGTVLGDLTALGYDAVWDCVPAAAVGAPHRRDRVWVIAYSRGKQHQSGGDALRGQAAEGFHADVSDATGGTRQRRSPGSEGHVALVCQNVAYTPRVQQGRSVERAKRERIGQSGQPVLADVADTDNTGLEGRERTVLPERAGERIAGESCSPVPNTPRPKRKGRRSIKGGQQDGSSDKGQTSVVAGIQNNHGQSGWQPERRLGGMADGFPDRLDEHPWIQEPEETPRVIEGQENRANRLKALGNAVVPQVVWYWGQAIMKAIGRDQW